MMTQWRSWQNHYQYTCDTLLHLEHISANRLLALVKNVL